MPLDLTLVLDALLVEANAAIVVIDDQNQITHWGQSAARRFGYTAEEVIGHHIIMLTPFGRQDDGIALRTATAAGQVYGPIKTLCAGKDGASVPIVVKGIPLIDASQRVQGAVLMYREVDAPPLSMEAQRLQALVTDSDDAIISKTLNGVITSWNPGAERMFGWLAEEIIGRSMRVLIPEDRQHEENTILDRLARGEKIEHFQTERLRKDGSSLTISVTVSPIRDPAGTVIGASQIARDITLHVQAERVIRFHATVDSVTTLLNRRAFNTALLDALKDAALNRHRAALLLVDLDRFKALNDAMGYRAGDKVLREAGQRIQRALEGHVAVARPGGDEFTVLLSNIGSDADVMGVAARVLQALAQPYEVSGSLQTLGSSIGVAIYPDDALTPEMLMQHAQEAAMGCKRAGGGRVARLTPQQQAAVQDRHQLMADLHQAVPEGQLRLVYQPVKSLLDGSIRRCEALVRWLHPTRGLISPAVFIPLAEEAGLIDGIGDWVFREATRQLADWRRRLDDRLQVSINLSPSQLRAGSRYFAGWVMHLRAIHLPASAVILEITENAVVDQSRATNALLQRIRRRGAQIAIDDFGTGQSSLSLLSRLDAQYLKIDQSFIRAMTSGPKAEGLVEAITSMAQKLGLKVVAEGVETEAEAALLRAMHCDYVQGYLFARPQSAVTVETLFQARKPAG